MAEETKTYVFGNGDSTSASVPAWLAANNGGGLFGNGNGWGGGILGFLLGLFFGNGWGGFGSGFGGYGAGSGAGFLSNQINNDSGRELLMNAITSQGEASRAATQNLATTLGQDFNLVNSGVQGIRDAIAALSAQTGMSGLQIINAIQSGNSALASQFAQCCCENKLLVTTQGYESQIATLNQTNALGSAISSGDQKIVDAISDLKTTTINEFCAARERDMQSEINTKNEIISTLKGQIDNANQTAAITGYVNSVVAPLQSKVDQIASKQLPTVPVVYPNITAVNSTPYYGAGFNGYGYGWNGSSYWG